MKSVLDVHSMTAEEKLRTMELLWDDLCHHHDSVPSPAWHKEVLDSRAASGNPAYADWDEAKKSIRKAVS